MKHLVLKEIRLSPTSSFYQCFLSCLSLIEVLSLRSYKNGIFYVLMYTHRMYAYDYCNHISSQKYRGSLLKKNSIKLPFRLLGI